MTNRERKNEEEMSKTINNTNHVIGSVTDCEKLNVRVGADLSEAVVCVLDAGSNVQIDLSKSTAAWFKVCTEDKVEGYCMRKFIHVCPPASEG